MKESGYFRNGLPFTRSGRGPHTLVAFQGLTFEHKVNAPLTFPLYRFLEDEYTVYEVLRRRGLPRGCSLKDMADDVAILVREKCSGAVDVIGCSTGGSIVQYFAADHPELVRRLVIHSSAYSLSESSRQMQMQVADLAQQGKWAQSLFTLMSASIPSGGVNRAVQSVLFRLMAWLFMLNPPRDASDLVATVEAEDRHNFKQRLAEIKAPTLVIAGAKDPYYSTALFEETAAGIPRGRLVLYEQMGHPALGRQFQRDVLAFLREDRPPAAA